MPIRTALLIAFTLVAPAAADTLPPAVQLDTGPMNAGWFHTVEGGAASSDLVEDRSDWWLYDVELLGVQMSQLDVLALAFSDGACLGCIP